MQKSNTSQSKRGSGPTITSYYIRRKRICPFCKRNIADIDHKDIELLKRYLTPYGRIQSARRTKACAKHQRRIATSIKRARHLALLSFVTK